MPSTEHNPEEARLIRVTIASFVQDGWGKFYERASRGFGKRGEVPDLISFRQAPHPYYVESAVAEIKISRGDARKDWDKAWRLEEWGMGNLRLVVSPYGVLKAEDIQPRWGWMEEREGQLVPRREPKPFTKYVARAAELALVLASNARAERKEYRGGNGRGAVASALSDPLETAVRAILAELPTADHKQVRRELERNYAKVLLNHKNAQQLLRDIKAFIAEQPVSA